MRGASRGGHRSVCLGADLALLFGSGRGSHNGRCAAAIAMRNNVGRSRLFIIKNMNPPICVASGPTPCTTIIRSETKRATPTLCGPQVPLAIALGTSVGWVDQGTHMPLFLPITPLMVNILRPTMVVALRGNCSGNPRRKNIRGNAVAVQEQGTSLSLVGTLAPPTPFIASITPLPNLGKYLRSPNQISPRIHRRDLELELLKDQPQQDLLTNTHNLPHVPHIVRRRRMSGIAI